MSIKTRRPSTLLMPFIKEYWAIENVMVAGEKHVQRIIPCGLTELHIYNSLRPQAFKNDRAINDDLIISGHQKDYYDLLITEDLSLFSIVFKPQGLMKFFRLPLIEIFNQNVALSQINKQLFNKVNHLFECSDTFETKVRKIETILIKTLADVKPQYEFERINHIIHLIRNTKGNIEINQLAKVACLSRKQFERKFIKYVGATPKHFLRIIRLQHVLFLKSQKDEIDLTSLAYEANYYDQAHFINDFKALTGLSPKQYFTKYPAYTDFFS